MPTLTDPILVNMAAELYQALLARGADTKHPPIGVDAPSEMAFIEYKRRGGTEYTDAREFTAALVMRVTAL